MRTRTYGLTLLACFCLLLFGLASVQLVGGGRYYELGLKNTIRLIPEEPYRGRILDRNQEVIVDNILSFDAVMIPQEVSDKDRVLRRLADILSMDVDEIAARYERGYLNPFTPVVIAEGVSKSVAIRLEEERLEMPGVAVELNSRRLYPFGTTAAHVIGYLGEIDRGRITRLKEYGYDIKDKVGYGGIEERLDIYMRGQKGGRQIEVDNRGRQVRLLGYKPPVPGEDVTLTIDLELQQIADGLLNGRKGAVVVMDVRTGEILVLSSAPAFDPNVFVDRRDRRAMNHYLTSEDAPLFNRAIRGQSPPGSVFKIVTAAAAMRENKKFTPAASFVCHGQMKIGNRFFKCWSTHGTQDFYAAMAHSCDIYFYELGLMAGPDQLTHTAKEFGLSEPTGIDLPREASGFIPSRIWKRLTRFEGWYDGDTANFSIGQGFVLTTPLQLARMMAVVANGGYLPTPHVTKAVAGREVPAAAAKPVRISREHLERIRTSLRFPVSQENGTARMLNIAGLDICAKTGTAQVYGEESHGWVAGFFPFKNPRYAFCVFLENAGSGSYAVILARDLFREAQKRGKMS
ncbi:MAG: penicillin-binding protein 2 [Candidatus Omnitrophica bacterium]|nr:penicillin-binding protein 2 [Candidatus Omnitrophota bacterium]MDD5573773.1 penicillin-binding protein 2 [Candidatus Omnitrophota bacterium]